MIGINFSIGATQTFQ